MRIGYFLSCEEFGPQELIRQARLAEAAGFDRVWISDHYHPWVDEQGHSPFVWSVIGALATATERLHVTTAVTCPTIRIHPAVIAQAAATSSVLLDGRFSLGVGSGEALNEHILGDKWPEADVRLEMLEESIEVMRLLWQGGSQSHRGRHYTVENARLYTLPDEPPPVLVSGFGPAVAEDVFVERFAAADAEVEAALVHDAAGGGGLGDHGGMDADRRAGDAGRHWEARRFGERSDHRPYEGAVALLVVPRVVVVGDPERVEARLLRLLGVADQRARVVFLAGEEVADLH